MNELYQQPDKLVFQILSEILEKVTLKLEPSPEVIDSSTCDPNDIQQVLDTLLHKVTEQAEIYPDTSVSSKNRVKNATKSILPEIKWSTLGISQTGRIMDPICLQKNIFSSISAEQLVEYQWPPGNTGDYYMLQEQVSTFLNIKSFKRKYPGIERRKLDPAEVNHLLSTHVISEVQVTLGLTALRSSDVCDLLAKEYPDKYVEYSNVLQEREKQKMRNKYKQYASSTNAIADKSQVNMKRAINQAAAYNAHLNRQRKEDFSVYYDMSTNVLQYPKRKVRKVDPSLTRPSLYPCALIPGQFQEYYHKYTKDELMYLPLNTALYGPPQPRLNSADGALSSSDSDSAVDSDASVTSAPRSVKSVASNKAKTKVGNPDQKMETSLTVSQTTTRGSSTPTKSAASEVQQKTSDVEMLDPDIPACGICLKDETCNKKGIPEDLIKCSQCDNHGHPSCLEMSEELVAVIQTYSWQCMECKTCTICSQPHREDLMMFCDRCDRGYHTFCVSLRTIPSGVWACSRCTYADPDFVKRKRKQIRASMSPSTSGRGRGRRRRPQRRTDAQNPDPEFTPQKSNLKTDPVKNEDESDSVKDHETPVADPVETKKTPVHDPLNNDKTPASTDDKKPIEKEDSSKEVVPQQTDLISLPDPTPSNGETPVVTIKSSSPERN